LIRITRFLVPTGLHKPLGQPPNDAHGEIQDKERNPKQHKKDPPIIYLYGVELATSRDNLIQLTYNCPPEP
jgi:hypothetical protein